MPSSTIELTQLVFLPGQSVLLQNISWSKFEEIISELGLHRASIIAYDQGMLEIMVPLPEHEYFKDAIGDLVKDLAFELAIEQSTAMHSSSKYSWAGLMADRGQHYSLIGFFLVLDILFQNIQW